MLTGGAAHRAAVLGSPVSHSLSPALHRAAYASLGLSDWDYDAHEVGADELAGFVAALSGAWAGLSLTMPLKEAAFDVADRVSPLAAEVGAINTLVQHATGAWTGDNTDVHGLCQALREADTPDPDDALVLGSGATARSAVAALAELGAKRVTFAVRDQPRPATLTQARARGLEVSVCRVADLASALAAARVVVSTLPGGTALPDGMALPGMGTGTGVDLSGHLLLDVVYAGWPTPLARFAQAAGAQVVSGFEMLLHQAVRQVELMTGQQPSVGAMRAAGLAAMAAQGGATDPGTAAHSGGERA